MSSIKDIKNRIKSVESTMQITKAMELVASSKLRKAKERAEKNRPYFTILYDTISEISAANRDFTSPYLVKRDVKKSLFIVISGDRGLAGGFNGNIFRLAEQSMAGKQPVLICIGRKTVEYFEKKEYPILQSYPAAAEDMTMNGALEIAEMVADAFLKQSFDEAFLVFTTYISALIQDPAILPLLPLSFGQESNSAAQPLEYEPSPQAVFSQIVPQYLAGMIYGGICESYVSEQSARRNAMEAATDNAGQMIDDLSLKFNRARQGAITQELTEIVAGANAGNDA